MSKISIIEQYEQKCGQFIVEHDDGKPYIYTERFRAEPLCTDKTQFEDFSDQIKILFSVTFADSHVMKKYATGKIRTEQEFEETVKSQSLRWSKNYPFAGFIITEQNTDAVVGYEVIGNGSKNNTGEIAYLFNKDYHNSIDKKYVGYENIGALVWGYGAELATNQKLVNQFYDTELKQFIEGSTFTTVEATARIDNIGSKKILEYLGFKEIGIINKYDYDRHKFELNYNTSTEEVVLGGTNNLDQLLE